MDDDLLDTRGGPTVREVDEAAERAEREAWKAIVRTGQAYLSVATFVGLRADVAKIEAARQAIALSDTVDGPLYGIQLVVDPAVPDGYISPPMPNEGESPFMDAAAFLAKWKVVNGYRDG